MELKSYEVTNAKAQERVIVRATNAVQAVERAYREQELGDVEWWSYHRRPIEPELLRIGRHAVACGHWQTRKDQ